ncbi:MAG TPA: hypothetical protein VGC08_12255 [Pedobacter sp.]|jgi:hypothetical protein
MRDLKLSSILVIAALLVIVYFITKYIVFPLLSIALGIAGGIISTVITVLIILLIWFYLKEALRKR